MSGVFLGSRFSPDKKEVEFRVLAPHASRMEIWIYAVPVAGAPILHHAMTASASGVFFSSVPVTDLRAAGLRDFICYGYRAWGPNWPFDPGWSPGSQIGLVADVDNHGNRFNPNKLLLDPYALEVSHNVQTPDNPDREVYESGAASRRVDTGPIAPKGIVLDVPPPDYGVKPRGAFKDEIIYEVHLRGLTRNDPTVPANLQGTYKGAAVRAAYLRDLGVTAVEFLPVHEAQNSLNDLPQFLEFHNYWGYDSISYFAPSRRYSSDQSPGGPTREWIAMVKAFHDAGLKVYIDVVYNHHDEADVDEATGTIGVIYSLRGLDNPQYYEVLDSSSHPNLYQNDNGVGPNLNAATTMARNLVLGSLEYWAHSLGVDGFRFDLAAVLGNQNSDGGYSFNPNDPDNILNRAVRELPVRQPAGGPGVDLIAEPYTADALGQEQGNFPLGWSEWNDRFRDVFRASQNKLGFAPVTPGAMATCFAGSDDLFRAHGRFPWNSVNYLVSHDGFTLRDLHSFNDKRNDQPFPFGPSDGGRAAQEEMCWDHGGDPVQQKQAVRTGLALLLLSAGVPMLAGGAEMNRTQFGNNNPYNLDTVANWLDWSLQGPEAALVKFTRLLLHFRLAHPALRPAGFLTGRDNNGNGFKDLTWYWNNGAEIDISYFQNPGNHFIAFLLDGAEAGDPASLLYVAYNGWKDPVPVTLPPVPAGTKWFLVADTSASAEAWGNIHAAGAEAALSSSIVPVDGRSVVLLLAR